MRTYTRTHSWISFELDLREASHRLWLLLGEAQSKVSHVAGVPLLPSVQNQLYQLYLAKGVLATTAIEGNTLTEEEVLKRIEGKLELPPSKEYLGKEIDNIVQACREIAERVIQTETALMKVDTIKHYNRVVLDGLPISEEVIPGEIRSHSVVVGAYRSAPAKDCGYLLERLCSWLNESFPGPSGYEIAFGILKAVVAHLYLAWIHPFGDGNGRTARLMEFHILLSAGVPATAAHLLSNHYNQTRANYYRQLDTAHRGHGKELEFIEYALQGFIDALREQIDMIKAQQLTVHLINYIHDQFRGKDSPAHGRRRRLAIALVSQEDPIPVAAVRRITPRMAEAYAAKTDKTVKRDISFLEQQGLIQRTSRGIRIRSEIMLAYLPPVRQVE